MEAINSSVVGIDISKRKFDLVLLREGQVKAQNIPE